MKKTFTINISGIVFNIDEDAYEKLNAYLDKLKRHFKGSEGGDEIINDIETRIAEILQGKLSDTKQVISIGDIGEIIEIMGQPSEFTEEDEPGETRSETYKSPGPYKRLYRDVDNRMLGGVSSGIAAYLSIDPVWIRLIFVILTLFSGIGILIYIILWIVVPEARTTAEKLEMKGEKVNISNIEKSIQEELNSLKDKINDLTDEAKRTFKKKSDDLRAPRDPIPGLIQSFFRILGRAVMILVGIILFLIGISFIILLIGTITSTGSFYVFEDVYFTPFPEPGLLGFLIESQSNVPVIKTTIALVVGIPFFMLVVIGICWMFGIRRSRTLNIVALNVWLIAFIVLVVLAITTARDFRLESDHTERLDLQPSPGKTLVIDLNPDNYDRTGLRIITGDEWVITEDTYRLRAYGKPHLTINPSKDDSQYLELFKQARGKSVAEASMRAENLAYNFSYSDTLLMLDEYFQIKEDEVWRDQEMNLHLYLPVGKKVYLGERMSEILSSDHNYSRHFMEGKEFIMTEEGLRSKTSPPVSQNKPLRERSTISKLLITLYQVHVPGI